LELDHCPHFFRVRQTGQVMTALVVLSVLVYLIFFC
jgi:hypothetical protein